MNTIAAPIINNWTVDLLQDFSCLQCCRVFTSTSSLLRHKETYREPHFVLPCCNERFDWSRDLKHVCPKVEDSDELSDHFELPVRSPAPSSSSSEHGSTDLQDDKFRCNNCPATFLRYHAMKAHILKYPSKHNFFCKRCKKYFTSERSLERHLCFLLDGRFQCSCLKIFKSLKIFKEHVGSRRPYYCCACKKKNVTFSNLINHIRTHTKEKPFSCSVCSKSFSVRESLTLHKKLHAGNKPFHCSKCNYSSASKWNLLLHERRHNSDREKERRFACALCGNSFFHKHHLKRHLAIHMGGNSQLCLICGKLFSQASYLDRHLEKHGRDSEKGRKCRVCGKDVDKTELYQHHVETGHFQFVCHPCGKVFFSKFNLERHQKRHSADKPS